MSYSQNKEDLFIADYFGSFIGTLLDIGANDGITFSNSRLLIENGWEAHLFEPSTVCADLMLLYQGNLKIHIYNHGIGEKDEVVPFYESGAHVKNGKDRGLVSTVDLPETKRWPDVEFVERNIQLVSFENQYEYMGRPKFDFISIDAEGMDWIILQQINLNEVGCRCLCIEYNSKSELFKLFTDYCKGFRVGLQNAENLIYIK